MGIFKNILFGIFERSDAAKELQENFLVDRLIYFGDHLFKRRITKDYE